MRILRDARENYPAWLEAIGAARDKIFFENYIFADDSVGREFAAALAERARAGVRVRFIYDWLGSFAVSRGSLFRDMADAGVEIRCFNPPRIDAPFQWISRDHRKSIAIDGVVGFVTGLCVSTQWIGKPAKGIEPWRDTGVEIRGPAVADLEHAFAQIWSALGDGLPDEELTDPESIAHAGEVTLRVIASVPNTAGLIRLDQLIASMARRTLWLCDAYFVGIAPYVQALRAAAMDGVDVRLLVPGASDVPIVSPLSRSGYRPLLEAGIRVFEWNGSMMHAKCAVADGRWARVGSTNLNIASWIGNYELDVAVEDEAFAREMEAMYEEDLTNATEIVLTQRRRVQSTGPRRPLRIPSGGRGSAGRAAAGALRLGNAVGAVISDRVLGPAEAQLTVGVAGLLIVFATVAMLWPAVIAIPLAVIAMWLGMSLLIKGYRMHKKTRAEEASAVTPSGDAASLTASGAAAKRPGSDAA